VARWLADKLPADVRIIEHDGEPASLLASLEGVEAAYLIDASVSGMPSGHVRRLDVTSSPLPGGSFSASTHGLGLAEAVELARVLGDLPARCIVYAIEGSSFEPGAAPSSAVAVAMIDVGGRVRDEIRDWLGQGNA
jgi:hydrogenase maturation protease